MSKPKNEQQTGRATVGMVALLCLAVVATMGRALGGELVYDDLLMVGRNPDLGSLANVPRFFQRPYWDFLDPREQIGFWRPLTATGLALGHALGGGAVWGFHTISLLAHCLAVGAAFALARCFVRPGTAFLAALLFGLHPLQVEGVAWITALNDPLAAASVLGALASWIGWRRRGSPGVPWLCLLLFATGLLAKESALALVPLAFFADVVLDRRGSRIESAANVRGFAALGVVLLAWYAARVAVFASPWAGFDLVATRLSVGPGRLALLRLELFGGALALFAWPSPLTLFRPFEPTLPHGVADLVVPGLATLAFGALILVAWRRRSQPFLFALGFVPCALSIMLLRVEALGMFPLSDRFLSLAVFGFALTLATFCRRFLGGFGAPAAIAVASAFAFTSVRRIDVWQNEETLFRDAVSKAPRSPYAHWGLGRVLLDRYLETDDAGLLDEAETTFLEAQDLLLESKTADTDVLAGSSDFLQTNLGYGWSRLLQDLRSGYRGSGVALKIFQDLAERCEAVENDREEAIAQGINVFGPSHLELEHVYTALGVAHRYLGELDAAETALRRAIESNASHPEAHQNLGRVYAELGQWELAVRHFEAAGRLRPGNLEDRLLEAQAYARLGRLDSAASLAEALIPASTHAEPACVLAEIAITQNDLAEATRWVDHALELEPTHAPAWYLRGQTLALRGESAGAIDALRRARELRPRHFPSTYDLGVLLQREGRLQEAAETLAEAYELCEDSELRERLRPALLALLAGSGNGATPTVGSDRLVELAVLDARRPDNEAALLLLDQALAMDSDHPGATLQKARLLKRLERHAEAVPLMREACRLAPDSFQALTEFGAYLEERGARAEAIAVLEQARRLGPPSGWPSEIAGEALAELDRRLAGLRETAGG